MGAGHGQMRGYCAGSMSYISPEYPFDSQRWIALDKVCESGSLANYSQIVECDFDNPLPLEPNSVDALICIHVMEHLPRPAFAVSEIARVLAPGGIFLGGSPAAPAPVSFFLHRWLRDKRRNGTTGPNGHINSFCPGDWKNLVSNAGLKIDFLSRAHFMRLSGSAIENSQTWQNSTFFGAVCFLRSDQRFTSRPTRTSRKFVGSCAGNGRPTVAIWSDQPAGSQCGLTAA
jgi:SAM-dependent methyltransferase